MFKYCFTDTGKPTMNETSETSVQILFSHQWFTAAAQGFINSYMVAPKNNYQCFYNSLIHKNDLKKCSSVKFVCP